MREIGTWTRADGTCHNCETYISADGSVRCTQCGLHPDQCLCRHTGVANETRDDARRRARMAAVIREWAVGAP